MHLSRRLFSMEYIYKSEEVDSVKGRKKYWRLFRYRRRKA